MILEQNQKGHRLKNEAMTFSGKTNRDNFLRVSAYSIARSGEVVKG